MVAILSGGRGPFGAKSSGGPFSFSYVSFHSSISRSLPRSDGNYGFAVFTPQSAILARPFIDLTLFSPLYIVVIVTELGFISLSLMELRGNTTGRSDMVFFVS